MFLKIRGRIFPVEGLLTALGATLLLLSFAVDFSYGEQNVILDFTIHFKHLKMLN